MTNFIGTIVSSVSGYINGVPKIGLHVDDKVTASIISEGNWIVTDAKRNGKSLITTYPFSVIAGAIRDETPAPDPTPIPNPDPSPSPSPQNVLNLDMTFAGITIGSVMLNGVKYRIDDNQT